MNDRTLYFGLALAGALPFVACALLLSAGVTSVSPFGPLDEVVNSYGLAIVCFLAGTHWAMHLSHPDDTPFNLLVSSNAVFLVAWFMYLLAGTHLSLATQTAALGALLFVDRSMARAALVSGHYFRMRLFVTTLAALSLIVIILTA